MGFLIRNTCAEVGEGLHRARVASASCVALAVSGLRLLELGRGAGRGLVGSSEETEVFPEPAAAPVVGAPCHFAARSCFAGNAPSPACSRDAVPATPRGWMIAIRRLRTERREGEGFARTVGTYSVLHNGVQQPGLLGRDGGASRVPATTARPAKAQHRCIAAGPYPFRCPREREVPDDRPRGDGRHPRRRSRSGTPAIGPASSFTRRTATRAPSDASTSPAR